jgi:integrase/recombinase XerD
MHIQTTTTLAVRRQLFTTEEELALVGFLAGFSGLTRDAYQLDLRQYVQWCAECHVALFCARRADIESFGRDLESRGRARATIARRLCTVACFYRYAEEEGLITVSPAVHVRRPRLDYESHATGLDRNEVGALLVAAGLRSGRDHALVSLLALNGLRVSEAIGANIERLGLERGHRTLTIVRKGAKVVTIPLAPRTARAIDLVVGERSEGPIFCDERGGRLDRHAASRIVHRSARRAGITKRVGPHTLRDAFITAALDAGVPLRDVQEAASHADPRTTMRYDRARVSTVTPPTSSPRSSPEPPANTRDGRNHPRTAPARRSTAPSVTESTDGIVEVDKPSSRAPEMILGVDAVTTVPTAPRLVIERRGQRRELTATHVAFDHKLRGECIAVRGRVERDVVEAARPERGEDALVTAAVCGPEPDRTRDLMIPDRPLHRTPMPRQRQLRETQRGGERLEMRGSRHPRHRIGRLIDAEHKIDAIQLGIRFEHRTEHVRGGERRVRPPSSAIETIDDVGQATNRCRTLHPRIVTQPPPRPEITRNMTPDRAIWRA